MKTILSVALLVAALGASAYLWKERYHKRPANGQAAATARPEAAESIVAQAELNAAKKRCFDASREAILKELKAPQTAIFANLSDVKFQRGEADSYQMSSYVDAQDALGAQVRMKWETLFDKNEMLAWMKIDDDELEPLEDVLRRLKGQPSREGERGLAADEAERVRQATEERSPKELEEQKDPKYRASLHEFAEKYLTTRMELQNHRDIKHSKLPRKDDQNTACYWLGNDVWEATGLVESIPPNRTRRVRQPWRISMAVSTDNKPEVLAYRLGKEEIGNPDVPRIRAGVKPTLSK